MNKQIITILIVIFMVLSQIESTSFLQNPNSSISYLPNQHENEKYKSLVTANNFLKDNIFLFIKVSEEGKELYTKQDKVVVAVQVKETENSFLYISHLKLSEDDSANAITDYNNLLLSS